ncbi:hypothetical protein GCM10010284_65750 [Streptomyces rubiginosohelvolus]|nr:hypothetical protein GCM10010284_65750 [Streptomyces rubiginosohelvolus]
MHGAFKRHHLLAEARRYLSYVLRGRPHQPGLDERIVQAVVDDYTRPVGRGFKMTADLHALYPRDFQPAGRCDGARWWAIGHARWRLSAGEARASALGPWRCQEVEDWRVWISAVGTTSP